MSLEGTLTELFCESYENLVPERRRGAHNFDRGVLGPVIGENHPKTGNVEYLPARSLGSHASIMIAEHSRGWVELDSDRAKKLAQFHQRIHLPPEDLLKLSNWVDTNCQFYGSYWGHRNLRYRDLPDFRPTPTFAEAISLTPPKK